MVRATPPRGTTLPELLISLAILAILLAGAYPALMTLLARQQVAQAADRLAISLALARETALSARRDVILAALPGEQTLDPGWQLLESNTGGGETAGRTLLVVGQAPSCLRVTLRQAAGGHNALRFTAVGYSRSELGGFQAATFVLRCRGEQKQVRLGAQGRIRLCTPGRDADCDPVDNLPP